MNIAFLEFKQAGDMHYEANRMGSAETGQSEMKLCKCAAIRWFRWILHFVFVNVPSHQKTKKKKKWVVRNKHIIWQKQQNVSNADDGASHYCYCSDEFSIQTNIYRVLYLFIVYIAMTCENRKAENYKRLHKTRRVINITKHLLHQIRKKKKKN